MTRYELENWCEKFLKDIFENSKPMLDITKKAVQEDWDEDKLKSEMIALLNEHDFKTYKDFSKELADFIEQFAKEMKPNEIDS